MAQMSLFDNNEYDSITALDAWSVLLTTTKFPFESYGRSSACETILRKLMKSEIIGDSYLFKQIDSDYSEKGHVRLTYGLFNMMANMKADYAVEFKMHDESQTISVLVHKIDKTVEPGSEAIVNRPTFADIIANMFKGK